MRMPSLAARTDDNGGAGGMAKKLDPPRDLLTVALGGE
jgi:hypothetical protein